MNEKLVNPVFLSDVRLALMTNLRSVVFYEYEKHLGIVKLGDISSKVAMLLIERDSGVVQEYTDEQIENIPYAIVARTKRHEDFSSFLGFISHGKQEFICLAKLGAHMASYDGHSIYQLGNFVAINRLTAKKDIGITEMLNDVHIS